MKSELMESVTSSPFDLQHQQTDLESKIVIGLERIAEIFRVLLWKHAKQMRLSPIQIQILIFLRYHETERSTVSYLAREFNLAKPTISDAVLTLERKGLVEKLPNDNDTRSYSIRVTEKGAEAVLQTENFANPLRDILADFPERQQETFWNVLSQIIFKSNKAGLISVQRMCLSCKFYERRSQYFYCHLLGKKLRSSGLRIDCPEFIDASDMDQ